MKGNNTITLNQSTLITAVQFWLDSCVLNLELHVKVKSVQQDDNMGGVLSVKVLLETPESPK